MHENILILTLNPPLEESRELVDVIKELDDAIEPGAESIKLAKDILLTEAEWTFPWHRL